MKKHLSVFFKLLFAAFAFVMFPVRSAAQLYVVDNNFPDSIEAYVIQTSKDTGKAYRGNTAFKFAIGDTVQVKELMASDSLYAVIVKDGNTYCMLRRYLVLSDDNPEGTVDVLGEDRDMSNHKWAAKFFASFTPYLFVILLLLVAIIIGVLPLKLCPSLKRTALYVLPVAMLLVSAIEVTAWLVMGSNTFWWCDPDRYGFFGSLLRVVPFVVLVACQLFSVLLYKNLLEEYVKEDQSLSFLPLLISVGASIPVVIVLAIILAICGLNSIMNGVCLAAFLITLIIGIAYSSYRNVKALGKSLGGLFSLFLIVYAIGAVIAIYGLIAVIFQLIIQILMVLAAIAACVFAVAFMSSSNGGGGSSQQPPRMYYDNDGNGHYYAGERDRANERIRERKEGEM